MVRPVILPRALASRVLTSAPVHVSRPASVLVPTSRHLAACLTAQRRHINQHLPLRVPLAPNQEASSSATVEEATGSALQHDKGSEATFEEHPYQKQLKQWEVKKEGPNKLTGKTITLTHRDGIRIGRGRLVLDRHWLRDGCGCSSCVDPHSGQKNFGSTDVPLDLPITSCRKTEDGALEIVWQNDFLIRGRESHTSTYSPEQVDSFFTPRKEAIFPPVVFWDKQTIKRDITFIEYDDWMNNDEALAAGVRKLQTHGIFFIRNAPHSEESVISMSSRIGNLKETLYGRTWDVRSKPEAENVAYTSSFLGLHQDMLYLKDPPRLQLLHCLENSCDGGESLFSDASRAAFLMKLGPPELRNALSSHKVHYHYRKHGHFYENNHSVVDGSGHVRWSPPFQAPLRGLRKNEEGLQEYRTWAAAAVQFQELLEREEYLFEYKMQPGDCVVFDNLRVVHGRRAFDTSAGSRWLKGTYNAHDVFMSRLRVTDESDA
ncbi:Gamma-butyrobetaine dioxygenase [Apiospora saccharicola]|uniref:Gamma-butyrobetaine dioxygenase n=1 Tax=Apiospora saccharicola TaxID=335842 RepID=A0ABR1TL83_9PEZI